MKNNLFSFILAIAALIALCSCTQSYEKKLGQALNNSSRSFKDYEKIVLIPGAGCTGCITIAEQYYREHRNDGSILFIFTDITSVKNLRFRLEEETLDKKNIILDLDNNFFFPDYDESIYPYSISLKNGDIERIKRL